MGNYKFRLSDMIPNAWFYKLKDMGNKPKSKARTYSTSKKPISSSSKPKPPPTPQQPQQFVQHRNSYYFNTTDPFRSSDKLYNSPVNPKVTDVHFPDPPRKSSRKKSRRKPPKPINPNLKPVQTCSVSSGCGCRDTLDSVWAKTDSTTPDSSNPPSPESNFHQSISPAFDINDSHPCWSTSSCSCRVSSSATDIIIDVDSTTTTTTTSNKSKFDCLDPISELELPPIVTKPVQFNETVSNNKTRQVEVAMETKKVGLRRINSEKPEQKVDEKVKKKISPRCSAVSPGVKIRANSPRIANKKIQAYSSRKTTMSTPSTAVSTKKISLTRRKRVAESFAIVKSSIDPQSDFRESMVEMIVENNIRASKDLEELLACYLSLNSNEYHDLIIKAFEQIWFDLTDIPL